MLSVGLLLVLDVCSVGLRLKALPSLYFDSECGCSHYQLACSCSCNCMVEALVR
ncbi:hypothetical protein PF005_g6116 [Phytophthora fragariae]|uniref:SWIM-type domain-containing protein n=2 Tax=Phytophthora TaxID=4783 RepID=A0A6A4A6W5_9STRA|nr:hypothetical protein PF003_g10485 [Phytophthora fragariae]KAE9040699.1 hypothetical protein PR002_g4827 [Phytophthora rubi]KAE8944418.1 hypothetical protein PF009_g5903 [Phytophthora fragariae]KAE9020795.1 hypothetical protein PF011_g5233 [Phytophthora fragariae]KAE9042940.1 hypothetical protein PR001_g5997 [Phytophthora rubi]